MYNDILSALETKLSDFAAIQGYSVAWPDVKFPSDAEVANGFVIGQSPYLEAFILPAETGTGALAGDGYQDYTGIYQINVVTKKGNGTADARAMVEAVLTEFGKAATAGVTLIEKSWASGSFDRDESYFVVPVSVRYRLLS
jgi:hypothetical protein